MWGRGKKKVLKHPGEKEQRNRNAGPAKRRSTQRGADLDARKEDNSRRALTYARSWEKKPYPLPGDQISIKTSLYVQNVKVPARDKDD